MPIENTETNQVQSNSVNLSRIFTLIGIIAVTAGLTFFATMSLTKSSSLTEVVQNCPAIQSENKDSENIVKCENPKGNKYETYEFGGLKILYPTGWHVALYDGTYETDYHSEIAINPEPVTLLPCDFLGCTGQIKIELRNTQSSQEADAIIEGLFTDMMNTNEPLEVDDVVFEKDQTMQKFTKKYYTDYGGDVYLNGYIIMKYKEGNYDIVKIYEESHGAPTQEILDYLEAAAKSIIGS